MVLIFEGTERCGNRKSTSQLSDCIRDAVALTEEYLAAQKELIFRKEDTCK